MDEDITIIDANTRNEKIKNFFIKNKKNLIIIFSVITILLIGYFSFNEINKRNKIKLANLYNSIIIDYNTNGSEGSNKENITKDLTLLINKQDATYSPLALYFIIDNHIIENRSEINELFDILIDKTKLDLEIKNLIIYKKALFNSDFINENDLIYTLSPIINSESIWKSHALYLIAEYFYSNNQKNKAKEFYNKILLLPKANNDIKIQTQKRLNRDLSE
jgi:predicted negative regulator of RcsB-dependent stress response